MKSRTDIVKVSVGKKSSMMLIDRRPVAWGQIIGTIENVARQYGVTMEKVDNELIFSSPKSRMQMFVEKLHFSGVGYKEL